MTNAAQAKGLVDYASRQGVKRSLYFILIISLDGNLQQYLRPRYSSSAGRLSLLRIIKRDRRTLARR